MQDTAKVGCQVGCQVMSDVVAAPRSRDLPQEKTPDVGLKALLIYDTLALLFLQASRHQEQRPAGRRRRLPSSARLPQASHGASLWAGRLWGARLPGQAAALEPEPAQAMEEEAAEAWLLDSLRLYNDLHVFELQQPTRVLEWTGGRSVCVAGYGSTQRNEILQLRLPQKLFAKKNQGLCPERDFKVRRGGFSDRPVYSLKHVPETSLLVTSGPLDDALQVWGMEQDGTDLIQPLSTIPTSKGGEGAWARLASTCSKPAWVLHGMCMGDIQVTEVESKKTVFRAASADTDEATSLEFLDPAVALACSHKGRLLLADVRQPPSLQDAVEEAPVPPALGGERWCAGVRRGLQAAVGGERLVARLSSGGSVVLTDLRNTTGPVKAARCWTPPSGPHSAAFLAVSLAPLLADCVAVSGFDGTVRVYDTHGWDPSGQPAEPAFVHQGHVFSGVAEGGDPPPLVTAHTWHCEKPRTLLSAASDGSLHAWDWAEPPAAS
ncbi:hypothetical protein lerEdw1_005747 [Lerista edwardsae]|nr:hypothetical protein lerEdw1_005747 [Lerista edwardsae]